jgi:hypothetical protein
MIHTEKKGHRFMAVVQFQFDESYDSQIMCVGGVIGDEHEWKRLESRWQRRIDYENSHSCPDQQITRFHATEMNCKSGEYKNWDKPKCLNLSKRLIGLVAQRKMGAVAIACDLDALREVFPKGDEASLFRRTYVLCVKQLMVDIAHTMQDYFPGDSVLLIHDHGNWDEELLTGYKAADMIAYEVFKGVKAKTNSPDVAMRGPMQEMQNREIPMTARWINSRAAKALYHVMKESGKYPNLDDCGVT